MIEHIFLLIFMSSSALGTNQMTVIAKFSTEKLCVEAAYKIWPGRGNHRGDGRDSLVCLEQK